MLQESLLIEVNVHMYCALSPGHSQILSHSCGEIDFSPQLRDKIWQWPGNKATVLHVLIEEA